MLQSTLKPAFEDKPERWIPSGLNRPSATWTMFCFPFAGGSAQYYWPWNKILPQWIELCPLQPPGHGERLREPAYNSIHELAQTAAQAIALRCKKGRKIAIFGHSLGTLSAFETSHCLAKMGINIDYLIVSGKAAPHIPWRRNPIHDKSDKEVVKELRVYNGVAPEVLNSRDLLEVFLPTIRADFQMVETYQCQHKKSLDIPTLVCYGREDVSLWRNDLREWTDHTPPPLDLISFPGQHFYLTGQRTQLIEAIVDRLASMVMCI